MADQKSVRLELYLHGDPESEEQTDRETRQLLSELRELDLGAAELTAGKAPPGTKSGDGFVLGSLLMDVLPTAISPLIDFLKSWTLRRRGRTLKIKTLIENRSVEMEFDPTTVSPAEVKSLVGSIVKELNRAGG